MQLGSIIFGLLLTFSGPFSGLQNPPSPVAATPDTPVDAKLHADVLILLQSTGVLDTMKAAQEKSLPDAKKKLMDSAPGLSSEFADEWARRMLSDAALQEYLDVISKIYEKHFSDDEIQELILAQRDKVEQRNPNLSDGLKAKFAKDGIAIQSEIIGGCTQVGARQGGEIAQQLAKEHPEWVKDATAPGAPNTN